MRQLTLGTEVNHGSWVKLPAALPSATNLIFWGLYPCLNLGKQVKSGRVSSLGYPNHTYFLVSLLFGKLNPDLNGKLSPRQEFWYYPPAMSSPQQCCLIMWVPRKAWREEGSFRKLSRAPRGREKPPNERQMLEVTQIFSTTLLSRCPYWRWRRW